MVHLYVKSGNKTAMQKAFLSIPGSALLNLAVCLFLKLNNINVIPFLALIFLNLYVLMIQLEVIKRSSDNNIEGTSTSFNEGPPQTADPKNEADSQVVPTEEKDHRTRKELKNPPGKQLMIRTGPDVIYQSSG